ncbi:hypothetical protein KSP40_PGU012907 [Platanthera guangdongensis]|uniref:Uncharacterized protein n=1 Tax=Platanthera guangdongensis TaxID=2320717 RepID=A0ABR2MFT0_9ASPA
MEKGGSRHFLSSRCYFSNFVCQVEKIIDRLLAEEKEKLRECKVLSIFTAPRVPQNIPLLCYLVSVYDARKDTFSIGSRELTFTPNDVALIIGLPNNGDNLVMVQKPYVIRTKTTLRKEITEMDSGSCVVSLNSLLLHVLCNLFFPSSLDYIPHLFENLLDLEAFKKINWAQAIHSYLMISVRSVRGKLTPTPASNIYVQPQGSLGYLYGCTHALIVSILILQTNFFSMFVIYIN